MWIGMDENKHSWISHLNHHIYTNKEPRKKGDNFPSIPHLFSLKPLEQKQGDNFNSSDRHQSINSIYFSTVTTKKQNPQKQRET